MIKINDPLIHAAALEFIADVSAGKPISLSSLISLLGASLTPEEAHVLAQGALTLVDGSFTANIAEPLTINEGHEEISIPVKLAGTYKADTGSVLLSLPDSSETITGSAHVLFVRVSAHVRTIIVNDTYIGIMCDNSMGDITIQHG